MNSVLDYIVFGLMVIVSIWFLSYIYRDQNKFVKQLRAMDEARNKQLSSAVNWPTTQQAPIAPPPPPPPPHTIHDNELTVTMYYRNMSNQELLSALHDCSYWLGERDMPATVKLHDEVVTYHFSEASHTIQFKLVWGNGYPDGLK